jgi:hypothetical protein
MGSAGDPYLGGEKSTTAKTSVWVRMNSRHVVFFSRSGAGPKPWRFNTWTAFGG